MLLQTAGSSPPPPPAEDPIVVTAQRARPKTLFSMDEYPREAQQNGWEGDVIADLTISPQGRVTECKIVHSSGHQVLDDATCSLMIRRALFTPARDQAGNPIEDHFTTPVVGWRLAP